MDVVTAFRAQAEACTDLGSPMYADLLLAAADDVDRGGPLAELLAGHEDDSGPSALGLRLLGSVHRLVLERRSGALAAWYPSVGGTYEPAGCWAAFRELVAERPADVRAWLDRPPQTNEVGRSAALYGGLLHLPAAARLPVRLFEVGSSGGLNLNADHFRYVDERGRRFGPDGPLLAPAWRGPSPEPWRELAFVERLGSDVRPVDPTTTEGRLTLTAYVWPDQAARHERLRAALALAGQRPPRLRRCRAIDLVRQIAPEPGRLTVLWHSVVWQYLDPSEQQDLREEVERIGAAATPEAPFAHLLLEPGRRSPRSAHEFLVELRWWPGTDGEPGGRRLVLGTGAGHGLPCTWEG